MLLVLLSLICNMQNQLQFSFSQADRHFRTMVPPLSIAQPMVATLLPIFCNMHAVRCKAIEQFGEFLWYVCEQFCRFLLLWSWHMVMWPENKATKYACLIAYQWRFVPVNIPTIILLLTFPYFELIYIYIFYFGQAWVSPTIVSWNHYYQGCSGCLVPHTTWRI